MEHSIKIVNAPSLFISVAEVLIGQFVILHSQAGFYTGLDKKIVLRTSAGFVNMQNPKISIHADDLLNYTAERIQPTTELHITVGDETAIPLERLSFEQQDMLRDLRAQNKFTAIKKLREITSIGLLDAKNYIDNL